MNSHIVTFGEIMMRLSPPGFQRFSQAGGFDVIYGGGESNVAVSLSVFGLPTRFVTRLPENDLGKACRNFVRQHGVDTDHIVWGGSRLGIYFLEFGAMQRGSKVVYDREYSAFSELGPGMVDWKEAFKDASWFHWTGITPSISKGAAEACLEGVKAARKIGLTVSCDLNYRAKLWKWGKSAGEVMPELVELCDVAIGNEEDAEKVFGIHAEGADVTGGMLDYEKYKDVAAGLAERFPNLSKIAITLRGSISASRNTWCAMYFDGSDYYYGGEYDMTHIVDRVGGGDSFCAGLIYGLNVFPEDSQRVINFASAASCLKHSIIGDFNLVDASEVEKLMGGDASGRVSR